MSMEGFDLQKCEGNVRRRIFLQHGQKNTIAFHFGDKLGHFETIWGEFFITPPGKERKTVQNVQL